MCKQPVGWAEPVQFQQGGQGGPAGTAGAYPGGDRVRGFVVENPSQPHRSRTGPPRLPTGDNDSDVGTLARAKAVADPHLCPGPGLVAHAAQLGSVVEMWMLAVGAAAASPAQEHRALLAYATHRWPARDMGRCPGRAATTGPRDVSVW